MTLKVLVWVRSKNRIEVQVPPELTALPPEQARQLAKLVKTGSITDINALAQDLVRDGGCPALAQHIGTLADEFDMAGLRRLVAALDHSRHPGAPIIHAD